MTDSTSSRPLVSQNDVTKPSVIRVSVGYPWTKRSDDSLAPARSDPRWLSISKHVRSVGELVKTSVSRRARAPAPFDFDVARLRGTHGQMLLNNLRERIRAADILIMDIGSSDGSEFNENVLLEAGMAIAYEAERLRDTFILKPAKLHTPSDLKGFLCTDYKINAIDGAIKIIDVPGFLAALRSSVMRIARERQMIGARLKSHVEIEGEESSEASDESDGSSIKPREEPSSNSNRRKGRANK